MIAETDRFGLRALQSFVCCRTLQSDLTSGSISAESVATSFRQMCQAAILHWWSSNRQQALYTNSLLNYGNQQLAAATMPQSQLAGTQSPHADSFWLAAPMFNNLLVFNYPASALPDGFEPGLQRPLRRAQAHKRLQPENSSILYPAPKKVKPASGRHNKRDLSGSKARVAIPELSSKLQKRLATLLELVAVSPAATAATPDVKQACLQSV